MDWLTKFKLTIDNIRLDESSQPEKRRVISKFSDLIKNYTTINDAEVNIQLKPEYCPVEQKATLIPLHLQEAVWVKIN